MREYELSIIVDQQWLDILGQISKHQDGFVWQTVQEFESEIVG